MIIKDFLLEKFNSGEFEGIGAKKICTILNAKSREEKNTVINALAELESDLAIVYDNGRFLFWHSAEHETAHGHPCMNICQYPPVNTAAAEKGSAQHSSNFGNENLPPAPVHGPRHLSGRCRKSRSVPPKSGRVSVPACPEWCYPLPGAVASPGSVCRHSKYQA